MRVRDVGGVGGGDVGLGHRERRADLARRSSGFSQRSCCSGVPNWASTSMLPVSGAAQLSAAGARCGLRPVISASGAYCRLVSPAPCSAAGRKRFHRPRPRASACSSCEHRRGVQAHGSSSAGELLVEDRLGRVDVLVHEVEQLARAAPRCGRRMRSPSGQPSVDARSRPAATSGRDRVADAVEALADGLALGVAVVDALEDHRELEVGERRGASRRSPRRRGRWRRRSARASSSASG